ncbi:MAG: hypothetical protein ACKOPM_17375 [Novosphingobium sp.]
MSKQRIVFRISLVLMLLSWAALLALLISLSANYLFGRSLDATIPAQVMVGSVILRFMVWLWLKLGGGSAEGAARP